MGRTACTEPQCLYKVVLYLNVAMRVMTPFWKSDGPQSTENYVPLTTYVYLSNITLLTVYLTRLREI